LKLLKSWHSYRHTAIFLDVWFNLPYPYRHTAIFLDVWFNLPYPYRHTAIFLDVWFNLPYPYRHIRKYPYHHTVIFLDIWLYLPYPYRYTAIFLDVWFNLPYPYRHIRQYFSMFGSAFHIHTVIYGNISRCLFIPSTNYSDNQKPIFFNQNLTLIKSNARQTQETDPFH